MAYKENPKTAGSGVICAIPQTGTCPVGCEDCFFQSGRSYLEPLAKNLPNLPLKSNTAHRIVRINDGNDSNVCRADAELTALQYKEAFFNTSIPINLGAFSRPVVLTVNPGKATDSSWHKVDPIPENLMFVRFRANTWNVTNLWQVVNYYTKDAPTKVPVVVTFMAYYGKSIPEGHEENYTYRKRTLNSYWVITPYGWKTVLSGLEDNPYVYTCGKDANTFSCQRCGNCIREYFVTRERMAAK